MYLIYVMGWQVVAPKEKDCGIYLLREECLKNSGLPTYNNVTSKVDLM